MRGSGTQSDPYIIETAQDLATVGSNRKAYFELGDDIDLSSYDNWSPIGNSSAIFEGYFDGKGHTITNLSSTGYLVDNRSLFGRCRNCTIKNLKITNAYVDGRRYTGILAGRVEGGAVISNICVSGSVISYAQAGGLIGELTGDSSNRAVVSECYADVVVEMSGSSYDRTGGGLIDSATYSDIINCGVVSSLTVSQPGYTANIAGFVRSLNNSSVSYCYSVTSVNTYPRITSQQSDLFITSITNSTTNNNYSARLPGSDNTTCEGATFKSLSDMMVQSTYVGWDFANVWTMPPDSYPQLRWLSPKTDAIINVDLITSDLLASGPTLKTGVVYNIPSACLNTEALSPGIKLAATIYHLGITNNITALSPQIKTGIGRTVSVPPPTSLIVNILPPRVEISIIVPTIITTITPNIPSLSIGQKILTTTCHSYAIPNPTSMVLSVIIPGLNITASANAPDIQTAQKILLETLWAELIAQPAYFTIVSMNIGSAVSSCRERTTSSLYTERNPSTSMRERQTKIEVVIDGLNG